MTNDELRHALPIIARDAKSQGLTLLEFLVTAAVEKIEGAPELEAAVVERLRKLVVGC